MHFVLGAVAIISAIYFFVIRTRNAAEMTSELLDVANDVKLAARRFGFRKRQNVHPVDGIDDPNLAIATIAVAFSQLASMPTQEDKARLDISDISLRKNLGFDAASAEESMILGQWLINECNGAAPAISRASKVLAKMGAAQHWETLLMTIQGSLTETGVMTTQQTEALEDIKRAFRVR